MNRPIPPDQAARDQIENQLETNFLVEAGAGSGKTTSLVKRMVNLVLSGYCKVNEMVAITFTRKAADELRERFQSALEKRYREEQDQTKRMLLGQALANLDQCFLGTIHSFCAKLLRERPIEAKIDPAFLELDESQDRRIKELVWHQYLQTVSENEPDQIDFLNRLGISPLDLKAAFLELARYPDVEIVRDEIDEPKWRPVLSSVIGLLRDAARAIREEILKDNHTFEHNILRCLRQLRFLDEENAGDVMKWIGRLNRKPKATQYCWTSREDAKYYEAKFAEGIDSQITPLVTRWKEYCHAPIMDFIMPAIQMYGDYKREKSLVNFEDLLMNTASLLRNHPEVRVYFQDKFRTLLVDEFQDTDPIQAQILFYLTGENVYETDWRKVDPKAGSLFVVGDPKQAIYRFRRADIDTYNQVKQLIRQSGGEVLSLTANFRSVRSIADVVNPVFQEMLPAEESRYQAAYQPLNAMRENEAGTVSGVVRYRIPADYTKKEEIIQQDAETIAKYIRWAMDGNLLLARTEEEIARGISPVPTPKDFMILLRYKDSMDVYSRTLERYGIANIISGGSSFSQSEEIHELYKLVLFLGDVEHNLNLLSVLKGSFFGLSDETLYQWKVCGGSISLFTEIPADLAKEHRLIVESSLLKLQQYSQWTRKYPPIVALEKMITDLGLIPYAASNEMGKNRSGYLCQLLELLRGPAGSEISHFCDIAAVVETLLDTEIEEELNLLGEELDAVRIMNLHKAKGLEAPVVFLAHPAKKIDPKDRISKHITRDGDIPKGYFTISVEKGDFHREIIGQPPDWENHAEEEGRYLEEEEARLLYVAATRAKNLMLISSSAKDNKKNPWASLLTPNVAEITIPDAVIPQPVMNELPMTPDLVHHGKKVYEDWHLPMQMPSYRLTSPTEAAEEKMKDLQIARETGGGKVWGSIVHRIFEVFVQNKGDVQNMDTFVEMMLAEYGEKMERKQELLDIVSRFEKSGLWKRILHASEVYTEVPFSLKEEGEVDQILTGVIDLVMKEERGWVTVDYKTDRVQDKADIDRLIEHYKPQVQTYARVWQQLTGEAVAGTEIYLVEEDQTYSINK
ncbi:UvrD-helicase domain-containing protein [Brevibacillus sp. H7]|uniref:UvrD-helicase domain-containing protein n=1 Tax=Brevibacillus sp. H7 TaxID=3349138 RepID=UPI003802022C